MFGTDQIGRLVIAIGLGIILLGVLILLVPKLPFVNRLGKLPGDIHIQSKDGKFVLFAPIVSSLLISLIVTIVINLLVRLFRK